jgi:hypothetical protein
MPDNCLLLLQEKLLPILGQSHTVLHIIVTEEHYKLFTVPCCCNPAVECKLCVITTI